MWPWKLGQGHHNQINPYSPPNNVSMPVWSKSIHWFTETLFLTFQSASVILKMYLCIYASLVKIHPLVQKITHGNHISDIFRPPPPPTIGLCKFGQNPSTGSEDNTRKRSYTGHQRWQDPHQKQYVPPPLRLGGHNQPDSQPIF